MRKKILTLAVATVAASSILTGCGGSSSSDKKASADENITAVSREDGSGTRGAFIELFGIEEKDKDGNKVDKTTSSVQITNSTSVMMTTVAENKAAIGYISLGSLNDTVKAVKIDGAEASVDNVKNGSYKIEREGIKFLLAQEEGEYEIHEAANGRQALNVLRSEEIDFLLTDIKMPHMDGLELASKVREEYPNLPIVIFSGYSDFAFAQEAMRYGVKDYVLKPVDPDTFHTTIGKVKAELQSIRSKKQKEEKGKNFLLQYFLQTYLYSGNEEVLKKAGEILDESNWEQWHCAILIESDKAFFDNVPDNIDEELMQGLHRNFFYLNLNTRQSVLFFSDVYCDYQLVAKHLYDLLKQNYSASFHLAVSSRFEGHEALPEIMSQLEQTMEEKFYHPDVHVFNNETADSQPVNAETQDSRLMEKISEDISRKDVEQLKTHFECLVKKYENDTRFSAMYVKFVFSNVIQELFQENQFSEERKLDHEVERLYSCTNLKQILAITQENIKEYEEFLERSMSDSRDEVASVKNYIYQHYAEDLSLETLAEKVYLSSGYLSFIFKKETGMNLNRFIRVVRMEKAKELLCNSNMKVAQVSEQVGIPNVSYFCRSFREYYGSSPESYRKGTGEEDENTGSHKE